MSLSTTLNLESRFVRPWRNYRYLAGWTLPTLRLSKINIRVTYDASNWNEIPTADGVRAFYVGMMMHSVTGEDLDAQNAKFQKGPPQAMATHLANYGTRGFRD